METALALSRYLGRTGRLMVGDLSIRVAVVDAKIAWGDVRLQVRPVEGTGVTWVMAGRVTLDKEPAEALVF